MIDRVFSENRATIARITCNHQRDGLPLDALRHFLRDVHCPCVARRPAIWEYRTQWFDPIRGDLFAGLDGVEVNEDAGHQLQFMSEVRWQDNEALENFERSPDATVRPLIIADVAMLVGEGTTYETRGADGQTLIDRTGHLAPRGPVRSPTLAIFLRARGDAEAFGEGVSTLARLWAALPGTTRLRLNLLTPPAGAAPANAPVPRHPPERQHQAMIEVHCVDEQAIGALARVPDLRGCGQWARSLHAYPVTDLFSWTCNGKPTLMALRGYHAAQAIEAFGAEHHRSPAMLDWMYGHVTAGGPVG